MMDDHNAPPLNPLPPVVWALALPMIAMEVVLGLGSSGLAGGIEGAGWRLQAMERFAFAPDLMRVMVERGEYPWQHLLRLISYPLVHGNTTHAVFALVILLALGKMVGEVFRWWAVLVVFFGAAIAGAAAYMVAPWVHAPLIGAYPPVYGLIGSFTFLLWVNLAAVGANTNPDAVCQLPVTLTEVDRATWDGATIEALLPSSAERSDPRYEFTRGPVWGRELCYSAVILATSTTFFHFSKSALMKPAKASRFMSIMTTPMLV